MIKIRGKLINRNQLTIISIAVAIAIVISGTKMPYYGDVYDNKFITVMRKISSFVPPNEKIVSSHHFGNMVYFMNRSLVFPHGANSEKSLLHLMLKNNYTYLLVFENFSRVQDLSGLFNTTGLKNLDDDFRKIGDYSTNQYRFHIYTINKNWTLYNE
ncbi:hypothetical protein BH18THE1_BH18THE1_22710 [soil metagenome]